MTELSVVPNASSSPEDDSAETNEMPKVDASSLPTIPPVLPEPVLDYAKGSKRGQVQVNHVTAYHAQLLEHGKNLLAQHHAEGQAENELDSSEEFASVRVELEKLEAEAETARVEFEKLQAEADNARNAAIAEIVAKVNGDIDFEIEELEYSTALINLNNQVKMFAAAGDSVQGSLRTFVASLPTSKNLVEGKRKGSRASNSTMPGAVSEGWKPRFDWIEMNGEVVPNVTTIGQLAKAVNRPYNSILNALTVKVPNRTLEDDKIYEWEYSVQDDEKSGETVTTRFRGLALSRATMNARLQAGTPVVPEKSSESGTSQGSVPEVQSNDDAGDAAESF